MAKLIAGCNTLQDYLNVTRASRVACLGNDLLFCTKSETAMVISDNLRIFEDEESFER